MWTGCSLSEEAMAGRNHGEEAPEDRSSGASRGEAGRARRARTRRPWVPDRSQRRLHRRDVAACSVDARIILAVGVDREIARPKTIEGSVHRGHRAATPAGEAGQGERHAAERVPALARVAGATSWLSPRQPSWSQMGLLPRPCRASPVRRLERWRHCSSAPSP